MYRCTGVQVDRCTGVQVCEAVMNWIKHDKVESKCHLPHVFKHVRLHLLTPEFLNTVGDDLIMSDEASRELVILAKNYL